MKYVRETANWWEVQGTQYLARTVHESEPTRTFTGLLDANGVKLYRVEEPRPIGFLSSAQHTEEK